MAMPKSVVKISKNGVEYTSSVDRAAYTIQELTRAALRDSGKFIRRQALDKARTLPGLRRGKRPLRAFQYWVRKRETDLQIGIGNTKQGLSGDTWYGIQQELGTNNQPKRAILTTVVEQNVGKIREIQGQYLSAIESETRALGLIDESEQTGGNDENE